MNCPECGSDKIRREYKVLNGGWEYKCLECEHEFYDDPKKEGSE